MTRFFRLAGARNTALLAVALAVASASPPLRADSPAPPRSYKLVTPGAKYVFVMLAPGAVDREWREAHPRSGLYRNDGSAAPLWTVDWYAPRIDVASDGVHLVRHGPWASSTDEEAISFFASGRLLRTYLIRQLVDDDAKLQRSVSHFLWREEGGFDDGALSYALKTKDGNRFVFDVRTGSLVSETRSQAQPRAAADCARTFCGCWTDTVLEFATTIVAGRTPVGSVEIYCDREETPIAVSDASGVAKFTLSTARSPGCHFARCTNLTLRDRARKYADVRATVFQANGRVVHLRAHEPACGVSGHASGRDPESLSRARAVLEANGIDAAKDFRVFRYVPYASGGGMVWVQRRYNGLPVFRDELAFHFDAAGRVKRGRDGRPHLGGDGEDLSKLDLAPAPQIDAQAAMKAFAERARMTHTVDPAGKPTGTRRGPDYRARLDELQAELGVYRGRLTWLVCPKGSPHPYGYLSAASGDVLYFDSGIRTGGPSVGGAPQVVLYHLTAETVADASVQGTVFANRWTWQCRKKRCSARVPGRGPFADLCTALAAEVGPLRSCDADYARLSAPELEKVNGAVPAASPASVALPSNRFSFVSEDSAYWLIHEGRDRLPVPADWILTPEEVVRDSEGYVSSTAFDPHVQEFAVGNGSIALHASSYEISGGSAGAAAGRDVLLIVDPDGRKVADGGLRLGMTKRRVRANGVPYATTHRLYAQDIDGDGLVDIGSVREQASCRDGRPTFVSDRVRWHVFRDGRWVRDRARDGVPPQSSRAAELPLLGLVKSPVDYLLERCARP